MQSFIAIHSNNNGPSFTTFDTVSAAKDHLQTLISARYVKRSDTLAIVRSSDDQIVYFKKQNNTIASLNEAFGLSQQGSVSSQLSVYQAAKEYLRLAFSSLTNTVIGR